MSNLIQRAAEITAASNHAAALTGAGISVESGIPPFRGKGGLWEKIDPMKYAHIDAFLEDPKTVWNVLIKDMKGVLDRAAPNAAHKGLFKLEEMGVISTIITQNVDGLHQAAGSTDVIEFHGSFAAQRCMDCNHTIGTDEIDLSMIPPKCGCGGIFRPDCVFFGEAIPYDALLRSQQISTSCDLMFVIGTSATVQPAAHMPVIAKQNGAKIIEINPEPTPLTSSISDIPLMGEAGIIMEQLCKEVEKRLKDSP